MAKNTLADIECDIEQCTKQRDRYMYQVQALDEQLKDLNNVRRELLPEEMNLRRFDELLATAEFIALPEIAPYVPRVYHVGMSIYLYSRIDGGASIYYWDNGELSSAGNIPLDVAKRMRQAYLDSVAATE